MKKVVGSILLFFLFFSKVEAMPLPVSVTADSVVLIAIEEDDVIYEKNPDKVQILASLTKVATAYTVINNVENLNAKITITERDIANLFGFTCAGLKEGDRVTYLDLLYAMLLPSGADASQALAIHTAGSSEKFKNLMNAEVEKLGLRNTHFEDSYGGDDNNVSTARDYSILLRAALLNPTFKKVFSTNQYTLSNGLTVYNYTRNFATYHGLDSSLLTGNKSGYTPEAGLLLASTATIDNRDYALIVCKSIENEKLSTHVLDSYKIFNYVQEHHYENRILLKKDSVLATIPVIDGTISEIVLTADKDVTRILSDEDYANVTYDYHLVKEVTNKNKRGDNLGYIDILVGDTVISTYNLYLKEEVYPPKEASKKIVIVMLLLIFIIIVLLTVNLFSYRKKNRRG